jgi:hypothetical protein
MLRETILAAALVLAACSPAPEQPAPAADAVGAPAAGQLVEFQLPSGNIGCVYVPPGGTAVYQTPDGRAELACDRIAPTYVRLVLSETGPAVLQENLGEAPCCSGETLAYGATWTQGPFTCESAEAGLTCANSDGHRFTLSRDRAAPN